MVAAEPDFRPWNFWFIYPSSDAVVKPRRDPLDISNPVCFDKIRGFTHSLVWHITGHQNLDKQISNLGPLKTVLYAPLYSGLFGTLFIFLTSITTSIIITLSFRSWLMETWTMSGWETNGCPAWVCLSTVPTSWSHWWTPACSITSPRKNWGASWRWWTVSTGLTERCILLSPHIISLYPPALTKFRKTRLCLIQGESPLWHHVLEALELWQKGAGEEEGWESTPEPRWGVRLMTKLSADIHEHTFTYRLFDLKNT